MRSVNCYRDLPPEKIPGATGPDSKPRGPIFDEKIPPSFGASGQATANPSPKRIPTKTGPDPKMDGCYWHLSSAISDEKMTPSFEVTG